MLLDEPLLTVQPKLAMAVGLNEAMFLQQLHWMLGRDNAEVRDGRKWVRSSAERLQLQFPFWSVRTIERIISDLRGLELIATKRVKDGNLYTVNHAKIRQLGGPVPATLADESRQVGGDPCKREVGERKGEEETPPATSAGSGTLFDVPSSPEPDPSDLDVKVEDVWTYYFSLFGERLRVKELTPARRTMLRKGLNAVGLNTDVLKQAFDGLKSYRDSHPQGSQDVSLDVVFKTRPGGSNLTDQIEFWAGQAKAKSHAGMTTLPPALRTRVSERKQQVIAMIRMPQNTSARERGEEAALWLAEHAQIKAHVHDDGKIEWVAA